MAEIFGKQMTRSQILDRVGDISQICDARKKAFTDGRAAGVEAIEVSTGSGLTFTVVPSRCLDISRASFRGIPVAWRSAVGETSPAFYQHEGFEWLRGFFGGLLTTCGLSYSSHPCEDNGESLGLHGRASNIPAEDVSISRAWEGNEYYIDISGTVREVGVFKDNLALHRTISTSLGSSSITITDKIVNDGFRPSPLMMLYHINPGWPIVSEASRLYAPVATSSAFDDNARREMDMWSTFTAPDGSYGERCYLHDMKAGADGKVRLALINKELGVGLSMTYLKSQFPHFVQWKMLNRGEYVVGIEPGNITGNRAFMRNEGTLEILQPGSERVFSVKLDVVNGSDEIEQCITTIEEIQSR